MIATTTLLAFIGASMIVLLTPGPGVLYVVTRGAFQGRTAAVVSAAGLSVGALAHVAFAVIGLSALLVASSTAFTVVKFAGAAWLIWIGLQMILTRSRLSPGEAPPAQPMRRLFLDGVVITIFNPKVAIFFLAYLPLFTDPAAGPVWQQLVLLGAIYAGLSFLSDSAYGVLAGTAGGWMRRRVLHSRVMQWLSGGVFIGLGVFTALATQER